MISCTLRSTAQRCTDVDAQRLATNNVCTKCSSIMSKCPSNDDAVIRAAQVQSLAHCVAAISRSFAGPRLDGLAERPAQPAHPKRRARGGAAALGGPGEDRVCDLLACAASLES